MGEYHLTGDIISRGGGRNGNPRSAVASAAYRSGTSLFNEYDGEQKDFSRKGNVTYSEIFLPDNAPKELQDRGKLWNYVEMFEKRANAQLARQIEFSLPVELSPEERLNAARDMAEYFRAQGMAVDLNIHEPDHETPNPHCHLMMTMRPFNENGEFIKKKCWREFVLDENGNRIMNKKGTDYEFVKVSAVDWDNPEKMEEWRAKWCLIANDYYSRNNVDIVLDHRSYERQDNGLIPTIHEGPAVTAMERKGIRTDVGDVNRLIRKLNAETKSRGTVLDDIGEKLAKIRAMKEALEKDEDIARKNPDSISSLLSEWSSNKKAYIQRMGYRQGQKSKVSDIQNMARYYDYMNRNGIHTIKDFESFLSSQSEKYKELSSERKEKTQRLSKITEAISDYDNNSLFKSSTDMMMKYRSLNGREKEKFHAKNETEIERGKIYEIGAIKGTGFKLFNIKSFRDKSNTLKDSIDNISEKMGKYQDNIETLSELLTMLNMVYKDRCEDYRISPNDILSGQKESVQNNEVNPPSKSGIRENLETKKQEMARQNKERRENQKGHNQKKNRDEHSV